MDQVVKKAKDSFGQMFDKSLHDLVRGIRNHKDNEAKYINEAMDEIKQELKQENAAMKANAVTKLLYLQMLGYDISWSAFNIIEVMSSNKFTFKRIGYLAASQCFHDGTDVLMLTTNMIRKDLTSSSMYEAGIAMSGLSCFINGDLARDLANDIMTLMSSTKPYIRKRAVLLLYKVFLNNPEALKPAFPRLKEKLEDPDPGVQSAAVNVICELARRNPKNYLSLAPIFFRLMTTSTNNWVLIKIIKLFGALTPLEPRLGKKLIEPLTNLIHSTSAMSLLYECINTVVAVLVSISSGLPNHNASIQLCVQKLRILIEDTDQNCTKHGNLIALKMLDVAVRVESIRPFACNQMAILLENAHLFIHGSKSTTVAEALYAAAWICGEFCSHLKEPQKTLESMLNTKITLFPGHIQSVYYQNILKIITYIIQTLDNEELLTKQLLTTSIDKMSVFLSSGDVEAQERASVSLNILKTALKLMGKSEFNFNELSVLFEGVLNPVATKAQRKVAIPNGLDLDAWINDPPSESEDESPSTNTRYDSKGLFDGDEVDNNNSNAYSADKYSYQKAKPYAELTTEELEKQRESRKQSEQMNPFYLKDTKKTKSTQQTETSSHTVNGNERVKTAIREGMNPANLPVSLSDQLYRQSKVEEENRRLKKKSKIDGGSSKKEKTSSKKSGPTAAADDDNDDDDVYPTAQVKRGGELPDGVTESGNEDHDDDDTSRGKNKKIDPHRALNIDLNEKPIQSIPTPPRPPPVISQTKEPSPERVETAPEMTKKYKKKKTTEKQEEASTSKSKQKHHNYKQIEPPVHEEEENRPTPPPPAHVTQEKPKKKKVKEKKVVSAIATKVDTDTPAPLLFDIMSDDIHSTNQSEQQQNEQDGYKLAAQSDNLTIEYSINPSPSIAQIDVTFLLKNRTPFIIDNVSIHVIDSMSSKLLNTTSANIISFPSTSLFPYSQNYIHIYFSIHAISFSQKLKTALTYSINKSNTLETDNIEFKLNLPCSQYLRRKTIDSMAFANLMTSGTLTCQSNVRIPSSTGDFTTVINTLCQSCRLTVVDKINSAASLYAESILGHPIALLIKSTNSQNDLSIDGKSTETHFLSNLMEELKTSLLK
ncbi:unnamed protein product [Rotaria magnacalcarata]|uniref:AP-3 complex subunit delta domain-containing protein n=1 Tax=Rotaria magnacalcarata TaxID=392030 RepID=A0A816YH24_9BILA|nr:unnamed protein product [Rotaria magnacalcarata]